MRVVLLVGLKEEEITNRHLFQRANELIGRYLEKTQLNLEAAAPVTAVLTHAQKAKIVFQIL